MLVVRKRWSTLVACAVALLMMAWIAADGQAARPNTYAPNTEIQVLNHVNLVLEWSKLWTSANTYLVVPGDELYVENGQDIAGHVVKLEFQSALAQAGLIGESSSKPASVDTSVVNSADAQNIAKLQQGVAQKLQGFQTELDAVNKKLSSAPARERADLQSQRDTLQGQIELAEALQDNLQQITSFMNSSDSPLGAATELTAKIRALERTVPSSQAAAPAAAKAAATNTAVTVPQIQLPTLGATRSEGLVGQMGQLIRMVSSLRGLDQLKKQTARLQTSTEQLRAPLLTALRATLQQGRIELESSRSGHEDAGEGQNTAADSNNAPPNAAAPVAPAAASEPQLTSQQQQSATKELVQHFKQLSDATLPLSQELILIDQSQANLKQLHDSVQHEYGEILRSLLLRVATLLIALGLIWLFSELWRRASFRYIRDARRRRQFLVMRRVVTGFCMFVVILLGFVSDFSSLATYAGLITAGIAVALQTVILSVAAYFFLVGRYGVRVGDRVTVVYNGPNSVTGDVVDIGLVRFYLMELSGNGIEMKPTGRIVMFPNSVLFQTNPLFKQFPGTEYTWREIGLPLRADSDVALAEKELLAAVNSLYADYRPLLEQQHVGIEETVGMHVDVPKPYTRVRFVASGLEVVVNYPIPLRQASGLDDRMVTEVMDILHKNPSIHLVDGAWPELRSAIKQ